LYDHLRETLSRSQLPYDLKLIGDVDAIIKSGVGSVPSVVIDDARPILEDDFESFRDFSDFVVKTALEPFEYGALLQLVLPILPDYDFRLGLLYGYQLACLSGSVLRLDPLAAGAKADDVDAAVATLESSTVDVAMERALVFFNGDKHKYRSDLVIWPYGVSQRVDTATPILYLPPNTNYSERLTACYHDDTVLPDIVKLIWPGISHCHDVADDPDIIVTSSIGDSVEKPTLLIPNI
jgi:hypothetical protein